MIIQILSNLFDEGYIKKDEDPFVSSFFSGSNVAFNRKVFDDIGLYDIKCATGEDQDISIRAGQAGWELYFQPKAVVGHRCRKSIRLFIKQWFKYGFNHPYIFKKHNRSAFSLFVKKVKNQKGALYRCILQKRKFPLSTIIFISPFFIMNTCLLVTLLAVLLQLKLITIIFATITGIMGIFYFRSEFDFKSPLKTIQFIILRYLANAALLIGGFLGGLKHKTLYISSTLDYKKK